MSEIYTPYIAPTDKKRKCPDAPKRKSIAALVTPELVVAQHAPSDQASVVSHDVQRRNLILNKELKRARAADPSLPLPTGAM